MPDTMVCYKDREWNRQNFSPHEADMKFSGESNFCPKTLRASLRTKIDKTDLL